MNSHSDGDASGRDSGGARRGPVKAQGGQRQLLRREERRAQLVRAAASSFVRAGFGATTLDDVAATAGVTRVIIYRHFESKRDLYLAVLLDTRQRIRAHIGEPESYRGHTVRDLALAARESPDGFRLLYRHASREPEFTDIVEELQARATITAQQYLRDRIPDAGRRQWIAALVPAIIIEGILTWLDADQPVEPDELATTMRATMQALTAG